MVDWTLVGETFSNPFIIAMIIISVIGILGVIFLIAYRIIKDRKGIAENFLNFVYTFLAAMFLASVICPFIVSGNISTTGAWFVSAAIVQFFNPMIVWISKKFVLKLPLWILKTTMTAKG